MAKLIRVWDGTTWQTVGSAPVVVITSVSINTNQNIIPTYRYLVNTSAARTLSLPTTPNAGDQIEVFDATGTAATYNITIVPNGLKINGAVQNYIIDVNGAATTLTYTGSTYGWKAR
jgi:hypothetical protein